MDFSGGRHNLLRVNRHWGCLLACVCLLAATRAYADSCDDQIGKVIAAEGGSIRYGRSSERAIDLKGPAVPVCLNSIISIKGAGRVTVELSDPAARQANNNRPIVTLGPDSSLSFRKPPKDQTWVLDLVEGWLRFFSPRPTNIDVETRLVTAGVRGTEFVLHSQSNSCEETGEKVGCAVLWVQEGRVLASNQLGSVEVNAVGPQSARTVVARPGQALEVRALRITPEDAVNWVVHYLPLSELRPPRCDAGTEDIVSGDVRTVVACGTPTTVLDALKRIPASASAGDRAELYGLAASRLLVAGEVDEAEQLLGKAIALSVNASFHAMKSVIALKQNDKEAARRDAEKALALDADSPDALLAMSYVRQAEFDLPGAREAAQRAADRSEHDPLLAARLAELDLSLGDTATALAGAEKAVATALEDSAWTEEAIGSCGFEGGTPANARDAILSRSYTVLGFTRLIRLEATAAQEKMQNAICADDQSPLARLGLGLALIRQGKLDQGVRQLEIAVAMDPRVSLYRSYLGKGYYEQDEYELAEKEFNLAKAYDEKDPTPWLYDAIRKLALNLPFEALDDMQTSIALSDYRAPYRSGVSLDEDRAAREVGMAYVLDDLGFNQRAIVEATRSLRDNPRDTLAHRFLADSYRDRPRLEIARASELLQAQLLQPINPNPIQPSLAFTNLGMRRTVGASRAGFNEYSQLFVKDGLKFSGTALGGNDSTWGDEVVVSGMKGAAAFSAGQFHYETDGFRPNSDLEHDIYNAFGQIALNDNVEMQIEYRHRETDSGDRGFDIDPFPPPFTVIERSTLDEDIWRIGARIASTPRSDVILSVIDTNRVGSVSSLIPGFFDFTSTTATDARQAEGQVLYRGTLSDVIAGVGSYSADSIEKEFSEKSEVDAWNVYFYNTSPLTRSVDLTLALGYESYKDVGDGYALNIDKFTPKIGITWQAEEDIMFRVAAFRGLKRDLAVNQTIEPTSIVGLNQLYDDVNGTLSDNYVASVDIKLDGGYTGFQFARRESWSPFFVFGPAGTQVEENDEEEDLFLGYVDWQISSHFRLSSEISYSNYEQKYQLIGPATKDTWILPVTLTYSNDQGIFAGVKGTLADQRVEYDVFGANESFSNSFALLDVVVGYKFLRSRGIVKLEINNLFDKDFQYQDDSFRTSSKQLTPLFLPSRSIMAYISLDL